MGTVELEIGEFAVLVTFGDAGGVEQGFRAGVEAAIAAGYAAEVAFGDGFPSGAITERAGVRATGVV
jgi:hypothetical protein